MKFRKLVMCLFAGIFLMNVSNIYAFAAEEVTANQDLESNTDNNTTEVINVLNADTQAIGTQEDNAINDNTDADATPEDNTQVSIAELSNTEESNKQDNTQEVITDNGNDKLVNKDSIENNAKTEKEEASQADKKAARKYTKAELRLLSALIYCEAQGESYNGKLAVGIVVMNRVRSSRYPDTVKEVIYQKYQFSPVRSGSLKRALAEYDKGNFTSTIEKACIKAAKAALSGEKYITVKGDKENFSKFLSFSGRIKGYTFRLGNHQFK